MESSINLHNINDFARFEKRIPTRIMEILLLLSLSLY